MNLWTVANAIYDLACHAARGRIPRNEVMFGAAGRTYIYFIYGRYHMLNIVAGDVNDSKAVFVRGAIPLHGWTADLRGPGKLARALMLDRRHNGILLIENDLFLMDNPGHKPIIKRTPRIGVDYAGHWAKRLLRFIDATEIKSHHPTRGPTSTISPQPPP